MGSDAIDLDILRATERLAIARTLRDIDYSLQIGDHDQTQLSINRWNLRVRARERDPMGAQIANGMGLHFIAQVVRDKGLRLQSLERALSVGKVTLKGSARVKQNFLKAMRGNEPLSVRLDNYSLSLEIHY